MSQTGIPPRRPGKKYKKVKYYNPKTRRIEVRLEEIKEPQLISVRLATHLKEEDLLAKKLEPRSIQKRFENFLQDKLLMKRLSWIKRERTGKGGYEKSIMNSGDYPDNMPGKEVIIEQ